MGIKINTNTIELLDEKITQQINGGSNTSKWATMWGDAGAGCVGAGLVGSAAGPAGTAIGCASGAVIGGIIGVMRG
ncbi:TPA: hypothetical protein QCO88_005707 [Bacillus cereus]|uniref:hypothetical protein n=1 Tax=Bacillus sp. FSL M8-0139 TaxID=2921613 RepID=UPI0006A9296F|nr:Bacteriocin class II with double-glycine leader peptide [Bacillus subtilis]HDR3903021.1 hypothetical protein [Bacillus cereus]